MKITVWNEFAHEKVNDAVKAIYPDGIHMCIARVLEAAGYDVTTATLDEPECGLTEEVLAETDVLFWWGHIRHSDVPDEIVNRVHKRVMEGMGMVVLHSGHASKIFQKLMGTPSCSLKWRESGDKEILWVIEQGHPITEGIGENIILEHEETYGEHFLVPEPDELVFISWFSGGEVFRSGCVYKRGRGKVFYFRPGHETVPTYHDEKIQKVLINAAKYVYTPAPEQPYRYQWCPSILEEPEAEAAE